MSETIFNLVDGMVFATIVLSGFLIIYVGIIWVWGEPMSPLEKIYTVKTVESITRVVEVEAMNETEAVNKASDGWGKAIYVHPFPDRKRTCEVLSERPIKPNRI